MAKVKKVKPRKQNREIIIQTRVTVDEMQELLPKIHMYAGGNESLFLRMAAQAYRPIRRGPKS